MAGAATEHLTGVPTGQLAGGVMVPAAGAASVEQAQLPVPTVTVPPSTDADGQPVLTATTAPPIADDGFEPSTLPPVLWWGVALPLLVACVGAVLLVRGRLRARRSA